jgi:4-hydroxy-tetrahydrodipicolinate reductase
MIKVLINGINGKMGQVLLNEINNLDNMEVVKGISRNDNLDDIKEQVDVIIDFSTPEGTLNILDYANNKKIPTVIATTGFTKEQQDKIYEYSKNIPIFQSSNMSFEINLMCDIVAKLAKKLTNSDIEIVETHHRNKVDAPSGTALMLANSINENNSYDYVYDRHSKKQKRTDREIGISSIRGGTEVGKHTVYFFGDNESFEITHTVNSRSIFAKGAIKAAEFIITKQNGFYNMKDLIKGD